MRRASPTGGAADARRLREAFHGLVRRFGLLDTGERRCGLPLPVSRAHALLELLPRAGTTQVELARTLGLSTSAVCRMAAQLERCGWVRREEHAFDGRARVLALTTRGRRLARKIDAASLARFASILAAVPPARRGAVVSALRVLERAIPPAPATATRAAGRRARGGC